MASAEEVVGRDDPAADWRLVPDQHARALPPEGGALKRVLERPEIARIMQEFKDNDSAAVAAQARYKRAGRLGLYAATTATVAGAIFLLPIEHLMAPVRGYVSAVQIGALVLAFLASRWLASARPFDAWMKQRAMAEIARARLFDTIARTEEEARGGELPLLPLKLEYFRRYQLDVQRRYYRERGAQHKAAAWRNNRWLSASFLLTILSVLLGAVIVLNMAAGLGLGLPSWIAERLAAVPMPNLNRVILALGVIASGLYGLGVARSLMDLDERNASRFETVAANLEYLSGADLAAARAAAAAGRAQEVLDFMHEVEQQISAEHKEWVILASLERGPDGLSRRVRA